MYNNFDLQKVRVFDYANYMVNDQCVKDSISQSKEKKKNLSLYEKQTNLQFYSPLATEF